MLLYLMGATVLVGVVQSVIQTFTIQRPTIYMACPERAICADVYDFVRDWGNGTIQPEIRIVHNCMCPGNNNNNDQDAGLDVGDNLDAVDQEMTSCPIDDEHLLHASRLHKQYLCRTTTSLSSCDEVRRSLIENERRRLQSRGQRRGQRRGNQRERRRMVPVAEELVEGDDRFDFYNYWKINCVCPRHRAPVASGEGQMMRATAYMNLQQDHGRHMLIHEYRCHSHPLEP